MLTVAADGAVPTAYRPADGDITDDRRHRDLRRPPPRCRFWAPLTARAAAPTPPGHRHRSPADQELCARAERRAGGRWLAVGGGYGLYRVVPGSWTHLLAAVLDRVVDPRGPVPAGWVAYALAG